MSSRLNQLFQPRFDCASLFLPKYVGPVGPALSNGRGKALRWPLLLLLSQAGWVSAGNLDAPGAPAAGSGMPSTADIYNRLNSGAAINIPGAFQAPGAGPTVGTGKTLSEIAAKLPAADNTSGATAADVVSGKTFWGLRTDGTWGLTSGNATAGSNVTGANGALSVVIPDAYYSGGKMATAADRNLQPGNIKNGVTIFGVTGILTGGSANLAPVANAGSAQSVKTGSTVNLNGSASSDGDGDPLTYQWTMIYKPVGSSAALSSTSAVAPSFAADASGPYVFALVVNDGSVDSRLATVVATAAAFPVVTATSPLAGASNISRRPSITATFDIALLAATVNSSTFTLSDGSSNIAGTISYSGNTATFTPNADLAVGTDYTVTLTTGISSSTGDAMAANHTWTFSIPHYLAASGGCVFDNGTGLLWEVKTNDGGLRDWTKTYTYYDASGTPQVWIGNDYRNPTQAEIDAATNAVGYIAAVNATNLCGHNDWRLPTNGELQSLVVTGSAPTINQTWFPNTQAGGYRSSSYYGNATYGAWFVNFNDGNAVARYRKDNYYVRLVRSGQ